MNFIKTRFLSFNSSVSSEDLSKEDIEDLRKEYVDQKIIRRVEKYEKRGVYHHY